MKFSLPVILLDELLKFVARNYTDGKENCPYTPAAHKPKKGGGFKWLELSAIVAAFVAYGYAWYLHELSVAAEPNTFVRPSVASSLPPSN